MTCLVSRNLFEPEATGRLFKHLRGEATNVNAMKHACLITIVAFWHRVSPCKQTAAYLEDF